MTHIAIFGTWALFIGLLAFIGRRRRFRWSFAVVLISTGILAVLFGTFGVFLRVAATSDHLPVDFQAITFPDTSLFLTFVLMFLATFLLFAPPGLLAVFAVRYLHRRAIRRRTG